VDRPKLISSIDAAIVEQMFGDDISLFQSLLGRLLLEYTDLTLPINLSPDDQAMRARLMGRTHKLKGSAGMIGAVDIVRLAGSAEKALQQERPAAAVEELLRRLATALTALGAEAAPYLKQQKDGVATDAKVENRMSVSSAQLDDLCTLLERQDLAALNKFKLVSSSLSKILGALRFDRVRDAIDNLDFQQGAQLLREAQSMGPMTPSPAQSEQDS
jgi:HPt (histidine-containing phosphotransfer) domain-containing protein